MTAAEIAARNDMTVDAVLARAIIDPVMQARIAAVRSGETLFRIAGQPRSDSEIALSLTASDLADERQVAPATLESDDLDEVVARAMDLP